MIQHWDAIVTDEVDADVDTDEKESSTATNTMHMIAYTHLMEYKTIQ